MDLQGLTPEQLYQLPGAQPPPGVQPNFDNPESTAPEAIAIISVVLGIMIIVVAMRMYTRIAIVKKHGIDDWAALAGAIFISGDAGVSYFLLAKNWFGPHTWNIRLVVFLSPAYNYSLVATAFLSYSTSLLVKASLFLFVARIFPRRTSPKTTYAAWFGLGITIAAFSALLIQFGVACAPRSSDHGALPKNCTASVRQTQGVVGAVINAVIDVYVLSIVIPPILALQMPTKRKVGVIAVLGFGAVAFAISIVALYYRAIYSPDPARNQTLSLVFASVEPAVAIITASLPALPSFWTEISTKMGSSLRHMRSNGFTSSFGPTRETEDSRTKAGYELHSRSTDELHPYSGGNV
ncbi:hypothetical protein F4861DRAFT_296221 [Xylaria intraflava]|nr:hypothetical protein F4861DRAFT_296221 [Xylaria intraflava]